MGSGRGASVREKNITTLVCAGVQTSGVSYMQCQPVLFGLGKSRQSF